VERRCAAAERATERAEERQLIDERTQQAVWAQNTQNFQMFTVSSLIAKHNSLIANTSSLLLSVLNLHRS
jgi:hypothetical protein